MDQATIERIGELWLPLGGLGAIAAVLLSTVFARGPAGGWPIAVGLVAGVAAGTEEIPSELIAGLIAAMVLEVGGRLVLDGVLPRAVRTAVAIAAAGVVAGVETRDVPVLVAAAILVVPSLSEQSRATPRLAPMLVAISAFGIWVTVPDTEQATALLGAAGAVALVGLAGTLVVDRFGAVACTAALLVTVGLGGGVSQAPLLGGLVAVAALTLSPAVRRILLRAPIAPVVAAVHVVVAVLAARMAGLSETGTAAAAIGVAAGTGGLLVLTLVSRPVPIGAAR
ncbi:MAG: hypothetical protein AAGA99_03275 [Actinomycetota bacterium]